MESQFDGLDIFGVNPAARPRVWKMLGDDMPGRDAKEQLSAVQGCELEHQNFRSTSKFLIQYNNDVIQYLEGEEKQPVLRSLFNKLMAFAAGDASKYFQKSPETLHRENENISRFIQSEARELRNLKFRLYGQTEYPEVERIIEPDIDFFILEYLGGGLEETVTGQSIVRHYQDILHLSRFGGEPMEDGLYRFNVETGEHPPRIVLQKEMIFLQDRGMIKACTYETDDNNLTHAGLAVLKMMDRFLGPSAVARRFPYSGHSQDELTHDF
ncbi:MAG: hypothetical protein WBK55_06595 [Alphaproteobacteria bacterium]